MSGLGSSKFVVFENQSRDDKSNNFGEQSVENVQKSKPQILLMWKLLSNILCDTIFLHTTKL